MSQRDEHVACREALDLLVSGARFAVVVVGFTFFAIGVLAGWWLL